MSLKLKSIEHDFSCWEDFVKFAQKPSMWKGVVFSRMNGAGGGSDIDMGTESMEQAVKYAMKGWPEGRERMAHALTALATEGQKPATVQTLMHDVAGDYPDVMAAIAGDPCSMICMGDQEVASKPVLRLVADLWASAKITYGDQMRHGIAVLAIVDALENAGYSIELSFVLGVEPVKGKEAWRGNPPTITTRVVFKRAGDPLDLDRAAFALANVAVRRRFHFAIREQYPQWEEPLGGDRYGKGTHVEIGSVDGVVLPSVDADCGSIHAELVKLAGALVEQGIHVDLSQLIERSEHVRD